MMPLGAVPPVLVFGWGNASRGDDALGPLFVAALCARLAADARALVEGLDDYQLQVEHALDLAGRRRVLFVDASLQAAPPFEVSAVEAAAQRTVSTHALSPQALLQVYVDVHGRAPPPATLLAIRGTCFDLGAPLGAVAQRHLVLAVDWAVGWVAEALRAVHE